MFICNLHCQLVLRISGNMLHKNTSQCKIPIVPIVSEEGWFGQPKYSTPSKIHSTLCRFLPSYSLLNPTRAYRNVLSVFFLHSDVKSNKVYSFGHY